MKVGVSFFQVELRYEQQLPEMHNRRCKCQCQMMTALTENGDNIAAVCSTSHFFYLCCNISSTNIQIAPKYIYKSCTTSSSKEMIIIRNIL